MDLGIKGIVVNEDRAAAGVIQNETVLRWEKGSFELGQWLPLKLVTPFWFPERL
jgi:hypothetical protein